ncbi:MAG: hypothetical protein Q8R47_05270 [Nanoarchaeota archaeon]|nr:hypothetical protein [Nanoarchaeota archaeon]
MFKKTVLVGILLVTLIVLSGCGQYDANCTGFENCYGGLHVPKVQADGTCTTGTDSYTKINGLCFATGDPAACSALDGFTTDSIKLKWGSVSTKYGDLCYPGCQADTDCGANAVCYAGDEAQSFAYCAPGCSSGADCLLGLTSCELDPTDGKKYCVANDDLSTTGLAIIEAPLAPETVQIQPVVSNGLTVDLELNRVDRTHAWMNIYLTSSKSQFSFGNYIELVSNGFGKLGKMEMHPLFKSSSIVGGNTINLIGGPYTVTPSAKTYIGRVYVDQSGQGNPKPFEVTLGSGGDSSKFTLVPFSACTPLSGTVMAECKYLDDTVCGALPDGCGGYVDCGQCSGGDVCTTGQTYNVCKSPVSQVLPANAPQYDQTVLQKVSDTLKNNALSKLQKLSAIVTAVKAWLAAQ